MYIGPWQELRLSQQQQARRDGIRLLQPLDASNKQSIAGSDAAGSTLGKTSAEIHAGLERTLLETLAPDAVAKVLAAVQPLINEATAASGASSARDHQQRALPPVSGGRRHHNHRKLREPTQRSGGTPINDDSDVDQQEGPTLHEHFRLPAVLRRAGDNATPRSNRGTPRSVRSSKSEPIYSSRVHKDPNSAAARSHADRANGSRAEVTSGCDSTTLAATLRMERNARPSLYDAPRGSQFAQFWNWDGQGKSKSTSIKSSTSKDATSGIHQEVNSKIARVKEMQKLYTSGAFGQTEATGPTAALPSNSAAAVSPVRPPAGAANITYEKPRTPEVRERDLTAHDMAIVSKYFTAGGRRVVDSSGTLAQDPKHLAPVLSPHKTSTEQGAIRNGILHEEIHRIPAAIALVPMGDNDAEQPSDKNNNRNSISGSRGGQADSPKGSSISNHISSKLPVTPVRTKSNAKLTPLSSINSNINPPMAGQASPLTPSRQQQQQPMSSARLFSPLSHNKPGSAASGGMSPDGLLQWTAALNPDDLDLW